MFLDEGRRKRIIEKGLFHVYTYLMFHRFCCSVITRNGGGKSRFDDVVRGGLQHVQLRRTQSQPSVSSSSCSYFSTTTKSLFSSSSYNNKNTIVDLRSDTVTMPSQGMLKASTTAQLGDDVFGEDLSTLELQEYCANLFRKEAGLFVPTGTMSNLCAVIAHCNYTRACEIMIGAKSHICLWEGGNYAVHGGGISSKQLPEDEDGKFDIADIHENYRDDSDDHCAETTLLCLENTHNMMGGVALDANYMNEIADVAQQLNMKTHVDGARIFNAAIALNTTVGQLCSDVDSVSVCFSKGLGTPVGSILVGNTEFIRLAKRVRKRLGGGMRQVGVLSSMAMYALENNVDRLADDHRRAQKIGTALHENGFYVPRNGQIDTNIVYFGLPDDHSDDNKNPRPTMSGEEYVNTLHKEYGVRVSSGYGRFGNLFRLATHLDIDDEGTDRAIDGLLTVASSKR